MHEEYVHVNTGKLFISRLFIKIVHATWKKILKNSY